MSRQLEREREEREEKRRVSLVRAIEFGLFRALYNQGAELRGVAIRYGEFDCLMTIKADINGTRHVAFIGASSMMNCFIKADAAAACNRLKWKPDKYHNNQH